MYATLFSSSNDEKVARRTFFSAVAQRPLLSLFLCTMLPSDLLALRVATSYVLFNARLNLKLSAFIVNFLAKQKNLGNWNLCKLAECTANQLKSMKIKATPEELSMSFLEKEFSWFCKETAPF